MASPTIKAVAAGEEAAATATIVLAFSADPTARWTWPLAHQYVAGMSRLVQAFGGGAFAHGTACRTEEFTGAALWLSPGVHPDEAMLDEILQSTLSSPHRDEVSAVFERMAKYHPGEPHWYLPLIGVDPAYQGKGHGDALMSYALKRCDRDQVPAYLESTNPRNISLYRRHGFEPLGAIQAGSSPTVVPMLRRPSRR